MARALMRAALGRSLRAEIDEESSLVRMHVGEQRRGPGIDGREPFDGAHHVRQQSSEFGIGHAAANFCQALGQRRHQFTATLVRSSVHQ